MANFNFSQRAYQIKQAYGVQMAPNIFPHTQNVEMSKLADGATLSGIGIVDSYYSDEASNTAHNSLLAGINKYQNSAPNANQNANDLRDTNVGPVVPKIDVAVSGVFGGSSHPEPLGNVDTLVNDRNLGDGAFVTAGFDGNKYGISIWKLDPIPNALQFMTSISVSNMPQFNGMPQSSSCRVFTCEAFNDRNVQANGGKPDLKYITLFVWDYDMQLGSYNWYVETFIYDLTVGVLGSSSNFTLNFKPSGLEYTGKHDIIFPCPPGQGQNARPFLLICPAADQMVYKMDIFNGSGMGIQGQAMAYSQNNDTVCIANPTSSGGSPNGFFSTTNPYLQTLDIYNISIAGTRFFDADWNANCVDIPQSSSAVDVFYFGDIGAGINNIYRGWSVLVDQSGNIQQAVVNPVGDPQQLGGIPYNRIMAAASNYCIWTVGPNYSNYPMIRVAHRDGWYKGNYWGSYGTDSFNEDAVVMWHRDCMDFAGQIGGYTTGVLAGLPSGQGNGHPLITKYDNSIYSFSKNYLVRSQTFANNISFSNHHNYIIPLGVVDDPTNPVGFTSTCYIAITGLNAPFSSTSMVNGGSFNLVKFWGI
jgi:hypothetical protein